MAASTSPPPSSPSPPSPSPDAPALTLALLTLTSLLALFGWQVLVQQAAAREALSLAVHLTLALALLASLPLVALALFRERSR
ncbi:hypothetical protein [Luteococcus peritonei]|uniref:Uncharacterized protein n=1 Tax=Luteococcus peritonei TaxID=88874 RepID=A0ABW4RU66_9ACTN